MPGIDKAVQLATQGGKHIGRGLTRMGQAGDQFVRGVGSHVSEHGVVNTAKQSGQHAWGFVKDHPWGTAGTAVGAVAVWGTGNAVGKQAARREIAETGLRR